MITRSHQIEGPPDRPVIVFLHGLGGSRNSWNADFHRLNDRFRLIFLDVLGFGCSPKPEIAYSVDDHVDAIRSTLDQSGVRSITLVGHSMGCVLG